MTEHPFKPGVEVAIRTSSCYPWSTWKRDRVLKVHKTGRFVLARDTKQQWRARTEGGWGDQPARAYADEASRDYSRRRLFLLSDVEEEMEEDGRAVERFHRLNTVRARLRELAYSDCTDAMLDAIEAALPPESAKGE